MSLRTLSAVVVLLSIAPAPRAAQLAAAREPGITGQVLTPDGSPVTQGNVLLMTSATGRVTAGIDRTGHFRIVPDGTGWQRLFISVPGFAPHRIDVTVPPSRIMTLPEITLLEATYFRARFVTPEGEQVAAGGLRRRSIDADGMSILDPLNHVREQAELDGSITIGPLPPGRTQLVFDRPAFAQTRLRDLNVNGKQPVMEGGTITIERGAQLHVDIRRWRREAGAEARRVDRGCGRALTVVVSDSEDGSARHRRLRSPGVGTLSRVDENR